MPVRTENNPTEAPDHVAGDPNSAGDSHILNTSQRALLLLEYDKGADLASHVDNVRNVITSFYLTLNGGILLVANQVLFEANIPQTTLLGSGASVLVSILISGVAIGILFVATLARLRRVQLERYRISNSILSEILGTESSRLRNVIHHTDASLPGQPSSRFSERLSGSYLWTQVVILPSAALAAVAVDLLAHGIHSLLTKEQSVAAAVMGFLAVVLVQDRIYLRLSRV